MTTVLGAGNRDESTVDRPAAPGGRGYRPHLDGLRAVAVYLVVAFHAGVDRLAGGFIGVDVFFVLSGYLVTQLLMRDLVGGGAVRFGRFYARRMRRLLPASAVLLLVTAVVYSAIASPADVANAVGSFKAAFLYVANWFFIHQSSDYFANDINASPVIHFWSLAIEEQFYFVWPLLLGALYAFTRRLQRHGRRVMQGAVAVAGIASVLWAMHLSGSNINRAYYGTDARAYQLLAGALLALSPGLIRRAVRLRWVPVAAAFALVALVVLSTSYVDVTVIRRGIAATIVTAALIVAIEAASGGPVNRVLSWGPMVYLGRISYGTYLWHWPVILVALSLTDDQISPLSLLLISALVATGIASLSYTILERPIREQRLLDRVNPVVIVAGLSISVICALVLIPYVLDPDRVHAESAQGNTSTGFTPVPKLTFANAQFDDGPDLQVAYSKSCVGKPSSACTIVKGKGTHVLVIGDSHAQMWSPTFAKVAQEHNLTLSTASSGGCPWQQRLFVPALTVDYQLLLEQCLAFKKDLYERVIPELKPDLIVAVSNDYLVRTPGVVYDAAGEPQPSSSTAELATQIKTETERSLKELEKTASKVLIIKPDPITEIKTDPFKCLTKAKSLEQCRFVANTEPLPIERIYDSITDPKLHLADFDRLLCPFDPICDPVVDGEIVRFDNQHITPKFGVTLAGPVAAFLEDNRLISSG